MELIITRIPIDKLEVDNQAFKKVRYLAVEDIKKLLTGNSFSFAIADIGKSLNKIGSEAVFEFWKKNKANIAKDLSNLNLKYYPGEFAFVASEWINTEGDKLILLEKHH